MRSRARASLAPLLLAVLLMTCGCSDPSTAGVPGSTSEASTSQSTEPSATESGGADATEATTERPGMVASTQATLAEIAETWELSDPPDVTVIRTVSPEEFDDLLQSCMASAGFPRRPDYSYSSDGQDEALPDRFDCVQDDALR